MAELELCQSSANKLRPKIAGSIPFYQLIPYHGSVIDDELRISGI